MKTLIVFANMLQTRRELISELMKRELRDRHSDQTLGIVWAYAQPLLLMLVYTVLFAYVFPARYNAGVVGHDYSANVLAGIVPWLAFQDILARSTSTLVSHSNLVKQIVFPIEVLPVKAALASALPYIVGVLFTIAYSAYHGSLTWLALTLPWLILCQLTAMIGLTFLLSASGVFFRDLRDLIQFFCTCNLFAQPILYNPFATPSWLNHLFYFNPFSYFTWAWQNALYGYGPFHPLAWAMVPVLSISVLFIGWMVFEKTRHSFGDAL